MSLLDKVMRPFAKTEESWDSVKLAMAELLAAHSGEAWLCANCQRFVNLDKHLRCPVCGSDQVAQS